MRFEKEFRERCAARGQDEAGIANSIAYVLGLERELARRGASLKKPTLAGVEARVAAIVAAGEPAQDGILALARWFAVAREEAIAIRLLAYLLPIGVLPSMAERLAALEGSELRDRVMEGVDIPPEGAPPESYPAATATFVKALEAELGPERARLVLTYNVHGIPPTAFAAERERYLELGSIDGWLADYHARQVDTLARHAADGTLWYEQKITQPVVEFVRAQAEMLGGVRRGDTIYNTKIPYDPDRYLKSEDLLEKRRLACHCPLAASTITAKGAGVPASWCACSAGYEKFRFDVVFGVETETAVLESVLAGDVACRFAVKIPAGLS